VKFKIVKNSDKNTETCKPQITKIRKKILGNQEKDLGLVCRKFCPQIELKTDAERDVRKSIPSVEKLRRAQVMQPLQPSYY
jgi:hypothetical protein